MESPSDRLVKLVQGNNKRVSNIAKSVSSEKSKIKAREFFTENLLWIILALFVLICLIVPKSDSRSSGEQCHSAFSGYMADIDC